MGVSYQGKLYLSGGRTTLGVAFSSEVWRSEDDGATWVRAASGAFPARSYHVMVVQGECLVIIGGQTFFTFYNDVWRSCDGKGENWEQVVHAAPFPARAGLAAWVTADNSTMFIAGGCYNNNKGVRSFWGDVWVSGDGGKTWEERTAKAEWTARSGPRLIEDKSGRLLIVAGEVGFTPPDQLVDIWGSRDGGRTWQLVNAAPGFSARSGHGVVVTPSQGSIVVIAGWPHLHDMWVSEDDAATFTQTSNAVWNCNSDGCGKFDFWPVVHKNRIYTLGGSGAYTTFGKLFSETWSADILEAGRR